MVCKLASSFINAWSPNDSSGRFYKIERSYEFSDSGGLVADGQHQLHVAGTDGSGAPVAFSAPVLVDSTAALAVSTML